VLNKLIQTLGTLVALAWAFHALAAYDELSRTIDAELPWS
jgi:hypothetical protein